MNILKICDATLVNFEHFWTQRHPVSLFLNLLLPCSASFSPFLLAQYWRLLLGGIGWSQLTHIVFGKSERPAASRLLILVFHAKSVFLCLDV